MELVLTGDRAPGAKTLANAASSVDGDSMKVAGLRDAASSVWSSDSSPLNSSGSDSEMDEDEQASPREDVDSDEEAEHEDDDELCDGAATPPQAAASATDHSEERYGSSGWQVFSHSSNTWLAGEIIERSTTEDGTSVLSVRYRVPGGRLRQKWVINTPTEVRRNPAMPSPLGPAPPAEWGVPMSPRSPRTVMQSWDQCQEIESLLERQEPEPEPKPEPEPEPEPESTFDHEVALATKMALSAAAATASGLKGIPPNLKRLPEGVPPGACGSTSILLPPGGSGKSKGLFKGLGKRRGAVAARQVKWPETDEGSAATARFLLHLSSAEVKSRQRHVRWIVEQRRIEKEKSVDTDNQCLADLRTIDSVDMACRRQRRPVRDMADIC
eukprot:COSAG02_NODE_9621_length_2158_cov_3.319087_1_plen_384_part_00